ncbi:hypothetical protein M9458_042971 [Cirrhinus mrigala]|uniref:Uncharacterized protein n=1 Tax=Cirrhinus mrigala TaxID=683832 RepID=A0ABD0NE95_CIRMR
MSHPRTVCCGFSLSGSTMASSSLISMGANQSTSSAMVFRISTYASVAEATCSALALRILIFALACQLSSLPRDPPPPAPPPSVGPLESSALPPPWLLPKSPPLWFAIMAVAWVLPGSTLCLIRPGCLSSTQGFS